jgi:glycosyltransferase involved in cell wall biosynthesis
LSQTYQNYELIVIDDGSTDHTAEVLNRYQGHSKITIHHNCLNLGMSPTWNIGLNLCRGEFIAKLDADDFYEPTQLETVVKFFQKHQQAGLVFSGLNLIYPDGRREPEMIYLHSWVRNRRDFLPTLLQLCVIRSPTVFVRSTCYKHLGGAIEQMKLHSDWEMWVRVAANYPVGFIARRLANYRLNYGSNVTARAAMDGSSIADLKLWLKLLEERALPYHLNALEQAKFRWGIYALEMHFAALAARYRQEECQKAYITFAEEILTNQLPLHEVERMRPVYSNLHQGVCAFREHQLAEARRYFWQAIKTGPQYCKMPWVWSKLLLTLIGRTKWGILYK